jgi:hypothetical protein
MVVLGRGNKQPVGSADSFPQLCHYGRRDFPFQVSVVQRQFANFARCDSEVGGRTLDRRSQKGSVDRVSAQAPHQSHDLKNMRQVSRHSFEQNTDRARGAKRQRSLKFGQSQIGAFQRLAKIVDVDAPFQVTPL